MRYGFDQEFFLEDAVDRSHLGDGRYKLIAAVRYRTDKPWFFCIFTESFAKDKNGLRKIRFFDDRIVPDCFQQFVFCQDAMLILYEEEQKLGGFRGKRHQITCIAMEESMIFRVKTKVFELINP